MVRIATASSAVNAPTGVLPARTGVDYAEAALTHWLDAQLQAFTVLELEARLERGRAWLDTHDEGHERYWEARDRYGRLYQDSQHTRRRVWFHCCAVYAATRHIDEAAWRARHADILPPITRPEVVWRALLPRLDPGAWPWVDDDTVKLAEVWNIEMQRELLAKRRKQ